MGLMNIVFSSSFEEESKKRFIMKKIILAIVFLSVNFFSHAQFGNILDKAKKKAEDKINEKTEKKVDDTINGKKSEEAKSEENNSGSTASGENSSATSSVKVYSKFDFVPGEKIVVQEDFMQDAVGDFPDKWNTNSSGEVVTISNNSGHWLMMPQPGTFMPEFIDTLPDNFTFEYDLFCINGNKTGGWGTFHTVICQLPNRDKPQEWQFADNSFYYHIYGGNSTDATITYTRKKNGTPETGNQIFTKQLADKNKSAHISIWRQKERVRVYFNEEKVLDIPKALTPGVKYNSIIYYLPTVDEANQYAISNLRLAVGAPDTRNKLLTEGKWVTHGILFDVNSATIKAESYGTIKEIATVLKENADVKVKIIGHTDSDGDDKSNMDLSKRRAAAVKDFLVKEFLIDAARMETDGMGESKPVDKNTTPEGKANNRRVEFVKI
jgi:outer membrane protein OmpA-like peptidoglycan-associated protein